MKVVIYTQSGQKKGEITLRKEIFTAPIKTGLMHEAMVRQLAHARQDTAFTKTKGEVRGGGRKPYRQKGTGRARQGSIRNPHYRGGGIAFGPRANRNYEKRLSKKERRAALFSALSLKAQEQGIVILDTFDQKEPKTKFFVEMTEKLPVKRNVLLVLSGSNHILEKSSRNLSSVRIVNAQYLNIVDLLWADTVLFLEEALKKTEEIFLNSSNKEAS